MEFFDPQDEEDWSEEGYEVDELAEEEHYDDPVYDDFAYLIADENALVAADNILCIVGVWLWILT